MEILLISPVEGPLRSELEAAGITVHVTSGYSVDPTYYRGRVVELATMASAWGADVALVNTLGIFAGADAALEAGLPTLWAVHESFPLPVFAYLNWGSGGLTRDVWARWHHALREAHLIYEAHSTCELHASEVAGVDARVIRYGVDLQAITDYQRQSERSTLRSDLGFDDEERVVLCMAVIQERKAQVRIALAFAAVASLYPKARLVFVGDHRAPYPDGLLACLEKLGVQDQVRVLPISPDTYKWYVAADVLISGSEVESLPRSMMEAQAFGLPIVAADVFGVSEIVTPGDTGWLFDSGSTTSMMAALAEMLATSDDRLAAMSDAARAHGAAHDKSEYVREYAQLIEQLRRGRSAHAGLATEGGGG